MKMKMNRKRTSKNPRPSRSTMAGMIYDANQSLNWILGDPDMKEAFRNSSMIGSSIVCSSDFKPKRGSTIASTGKSQELESQKPITKSSSSSSLANLFSDVEERDLLGIGLFTIWEAGLILSGYGGSGIVLSRNIMTGEWSAPVAVGISGIGAGILLGASVKTIVYLIYDYFTLQSIIGTDGGLIFGAGAGATVGTWTKETGKQTAYITSPKMLRTAGLGSNVALCWGLAGMYGAMSVEAGICRCRDKINAQFYGKEKISGSDILLSGETIEIPNNTKVDGNDNATISNYQAKRLLEKIHSKLERLCCRDGSNHGEDKNNNSSNYHLNDASNSKNNNNKNDTSTNIENKPENVRETLEELYADKSYDEIDNNDVPGNGETTLVPITPLENSPPLLATEPNAQ